MPSRQYTTPFEIRPVTASGLTQESVRREKDDDMFMAADRVREID
jgi:hypothetical protein